MLHLFVVCVFLENSNTMKYLIKITKCMYLVSLILLCLSIYAMLVQSFAWVIFVTSFALIAYFSKQEYQEMEEDISACINSLVYDIKESCNEIEEAGIHTLDLFYNDYRFVVKIHYMFDIKSEIGASYMGDNEVIINKNKEYIGVLKLECFNTFDEPYDYGFTESELQDKL